MTDTPLGHDTFNVLARQLAAPSCRLTKLQLKDVLAGGGERTSWRTAAPWHAFAMAEHACMAPCRMHASAMCT